MMTETQAEILTLMRDGLVASQIAKKLGIPEKEVNWQRNKYLKDWARENREIRKEQYAINFWRLEELWSRVSEKLKDPGNGIKALECLVKMGLQILKRENDQLGLDEGEKLINIIGAMSLEDQARILTGAKPNLFGLLPGKPPEDIGIRNTALKPDTA